MQQEGQYHLAVFEISRYKFFRLSKVAETESCRDECDIRGIEAELDNISFGFGEIVNFLYFSPLKDRESRGRFLIWQLLGPNKKYTE